jgi:hypothetical protein
VGKDGGSCGSSGSRPWVRTASNSTHNTLKSSAQGWRRAAVVAGGGGGARDGGGRPSWGTEAAVRGMEACGRHSGGGGSARDGDARPSRRWKRAAVAEMEVVVRSVEPGRRGPLDFPWRFGVRGSSMGCRRRRDNREFLFEHQSYRGRRWVRPKIPGNVGGTLHRFVTWRITDRVIRTKGTTLDPEARGDVASA